MTAGGGSRRDEPTGPSVPPLCAEAHTSTRVRGKLRHRDGTVMPLQLAVHAFGDGTRLPPTATCRLHHAELTDPGLRSAGRAGPRANQGLPPHRSRPFSSENGRQCDSPAIENSAPEFGQLRDVE